MNIFPKENFMFIVFEEGFIYNRQATINNIENFLGVSHEELNIEVHSNEAGEAKNTAMRDLVRKPNFAKQLLKIILPSKKFRQNLRKSFIKKNMKKVAASKLAKEEKIEIINKYFLEDIKLTEQLTGKSLSNWLK